MYFFVLSTIWSAPWARAQLKNRTEGSGERQLTGEPPFLTQVPKESDANTPSALSIAFTYSLLLIPSPLGGGSSPQMCAVNLGIFGGLDRALFLEGPTIHQHLQMPIGNRWLSQLQQQVFVLFFFLCLTLSVGFQARDWKAVSVLWYLCAIRETKARESWA